ncbi:acyl-CoA dehydrogenase [Aggregicoccus sp. 17bor-14]|uniref:acyl-CoA dehydrogenase family protein n=1 Tax=Myxococcaceae TaxID=31 RepID=UPI00129C5467|nr:MULTISPECIES: acyl-CoA dehydrogenase family protein [Myxococcaceae]MBF5044398.1 acyl-CoA dehydrogenase family protein [Simulacricoccus sp. 17bor-14]MRI90145.1 acyl-CoA dehydrogenase [Aggregicoccus sp. 17bor-14]
MAAVLETKHPAQVPAGGAFLFEEVGSVRITTPEAFTEEQRLYLKTALQFSREQVLAQSEAIERKEPGVLRELLRRAGELGLLMIDIPEAHGGLGLDKTTSLILAESMSLHGSWSVTFGAHTGIGSLPIVWFGSEAQKAKYLPKLATAELVAAYALTEQGSGSDALGAKTKAVLSPDGKEWILNGSKLYITNAAFADVFVVFAKVDGDKFTGFIVEKGAPGFSVGPEEHKMGIRGSSTCPLYFEDARIPRENLLGEVGKGHKIAFNILNYGRLKLGAGVLGSMKLQLASALAFAQERKQFGTPIAQFPLTREKFARMAGLIYAVESMTYRTGGLVDARLAGEDKAAADYDAKLIASIEEYAIESSIMKVFGSEALGQLVDDAVQVHGGAGYIEEYPVERAYRDARINRIFEGTNEINRMLIAGMLLKRTLKGSLPLFQVAQQLDEALAKGSVPAPAAGDALAAEAHAAECTKRLAIYALKVAAERFGPELEKHQEVLAAVADVVMDAFALDSMVTRTRQAASEGKLDPVRVALVQAFATEASARSYERTKRALCASSEGAALEGHLKAIAPLYRFVPRDPVALRETVVAALEKSGGYPFEQA